ncbi:type IV secretion system protein VirB10 [Campylobacter lanienae]|uniref:type IV secretion system protein VirB10 n=1 Tax=Campylobacter lanienae TaxID=75658 RepID=UPI000BB3FA0C|nr:type IV secretion system protein VirB10 [Campylobacter lanienae]MDD5786350.1 type IV secretion system protein VirB10 [Campylobacter lanienae]
MSDNQNNEILQDDSDIKDEKIGKNKVMVLGVAIFALFLVGIVLWTTFSTKKQPIEAKSTQMNFDRKDLKNKDFSSSNEEIDISEAKNEVAENIIAPAENSRFHNKPIVANKPEVYKSSSLLILNNSDNIDTTNVVKAKEGSSGLNMDDPCVVYDEGQKKFRKLGEDECKYRLSKGITSKYMSKAEVTDDIYQTGVYKPTRAIKNDFNPSLTLPEGTYIGCSLNTKIVSMISGQINCTISNNVYSQDGKVLLIEKGSKMSGGFKSGELNDGMNRIFVVWNNIRTTQNIDIPISSGATDELGGAGIEGWVDYHYFKRFGSAILISVIDDAMGALVDRYVRKTHENPNSMVANSSDDATAQTRETAKEIASKVLDQFANIKPTLYRNHGDIVGVYVNRDVDFSNVYELEWSYK